MTDHQRILVALLSRAEHPDDAAGCVTPLELVALLRDLDMERHPAACA